MRLLTGTFDWQEPRKSFQVLGKEMMRQEEGKLIAERKEFLKMVNKKLLRDCISKQVSNY